jgi:membrane protease subunit HflK
MLTDVKAKGSQDSLEVRMAWNNNSGGPWGGGGSGGGGGGGGPWGGGGGGNRGGGPFGSRRPPDMEDVIRKGQERLRNLMPGGFGSFKGILLIALAAIVIWLLTGFFRVQPNQQAIQLIFGKPYGGPVASGLHYNLPSPIGSVVVVNVQDQRRLVIGSRNSDRSSYRGSRATSTENLMLTGDENIVDIEFAVLWQIKDVFQYAFGVRNGEETVRATAEAAMREVIGQSNLQYAQTEGRTRIEQDTKELMQRVLDEYGLGAQIAQVQLLRVDPPQEVIGAFRDVQAARADKEKTINEANTYRNQVMPRAKGEAESIIQKGEAYKAQTVNRAKGDVQRFNQVYEQYAKAKDITTERLYLETIEDVLRNVNKVVVDKKGGPGVIPYLPLPELKPNQNQSPSGMSLPRTPPPSPPPSTSTGGSR